MYLAEVKGPVYDRLQKIGLIDKLGRDRVFISTHQAILHLTQVKL
jgi:sulfate permease, SulP family